MRTRKFLIGLCGVMALAILAACSGVKSPRRPAASFEGAGDAFHNLSLDEALNKARDDDKLVMVDFNATWCKPCRDLDNRTWKDPKVQAWLRDMTVAIKIDVDKHKDLARKYKAPPIPVLVFLKPDGTEVGRILGYREPVDFLMEANDLVHGIKVSCNWIPTHDLRR